MKTKLLLDGSDNSLDTLKLSVLYFDKIILQNPVYVHHIGKYDKQKNETRMELALLYDKNISAHTSILKQEGILEEETYTALSKSINNIEFDFNDFCKDIIGRNIGDLFNNVKANEKSIETTDDTYITDLIAKECFDNTITQAEKNSLKEHHGLDFDQSPGTVQAYWLMHLYKYMLNGIFDSLSLGNNCLSNSDFINKLISSFYLNKDVLTKNAEIESCAKNNIALNCIPILLPNISLLSLEDILEIKLKASDELAELKSYICMISEEVYPLIEKNDYSKMNELLKKKIDPSIKQFENKMFNMKISVGQKILQEIKNPLSYSPLIATIFANVPIHITLAASLALTSATTFMEYLKHKNDIKNDALYFTLKLRR